MDRRIFRNLDYTLLAVVGFLFVVGLVMVYSATHANTTLTGGHPFIFLQKQFLTAIIGIVCGFIMLFFDYRISDRMSQLLYILNLVILLLVWSPLGVERNGAQSWLLGGSLQPSELSKIILIMTLGKHLAEKESLDSYFSFIGPFIHLFFPLLLVLLQPDLGTALVFIFFFFTMMYVAGAPGWKLLLIVGIGVCLLVGVFVSHFYFGTWVPLKNYQIDRLTSFLNPEKDSQGSGWNVRQAMIAVGSGQFFGKGLFKGTQGRLGYLPENHTDFIFAVLCEEVGFFGGFFVLFLYFTLVWRGIKIAFQAKDKTGSLIATGIISIFLFHVLENVGMNIGVMPITGIPLPFISYGGSAIVSNLLGISILSNIWARRQKIMF